MPKLRVLFDVLCLLLCGSYVKRRARDSKIQYQLYNAFKEVEPTRGEENPLQRARQAGGMSASNPLRFL
jgi:hypothetical protein